MNILRRKSFEDLMETTEEKKLTKALGAFDITLMGLGIIIGTGIFVLTGIGAAKYAGPGLMLSFVLAAVTCTFVCLAYSELASFLPVSGSSYTYAYASLGEVFGWWVGWSLILEYSVGASAVAGGWSAYFVGILHSCGIDLPKALTAVPAEGGLINGSPSCRTAFTASPPARLCCSLLTLVSMPCPQRRKKRKIRNGICLSASSPPWLSVRFCTSPYALL